MAKKSTQVVAEVCMYGNHQCGPGWLASIGPISDGVVIGDGGPNPRHSFTGALWEALGQVEGRVSDGLVNVFAPGGQMMATIRVTERPYYGDLKWAPAKVYVLSAEQVLAASSDPS
jgi:hypothetical protein